MGIHDPAVAATLFTVGVIAVTVEFMWPGRYVPGALGLALCCLAVASLAQFPVSVDGLILALASATAFAIQAARRWGLLPGVAGSIFWIFANHKARLTWPLAVILAVCAGGLLTFSLGTACRSRETKRHSI